MATHDDFIQDSRWRNRQLIKWAEKIDSELDDNQWNQLCIVNCLNLVLTALGNESLLATGSCVEGSKVNIPGDNGDIDMMVVCGKIKLSEEQFEYIDAYPAFMLINGKGMHDISKITLINDAYLPASCLKGFSKSCFYMIRVALMCVGSWPSFKADGRAVIPRPSAVGLESLSVAGVYGLGAMTNYRSDVPDFYPAVLKLLPNIVESIKNVNEELQGDVKIPYAVEIIANELTKLSNEIKKTPRKDKRSAMINRSLDVARCLALTIESESDEDDEDDEDETRTVIVNKNSCIGYKDAELLDDQNPSSSAFEDSEVRFDNDLDTSADEEHADDFLEEQIPSSLQQNQTAELSINSTPTTSSCATATGSSVNTNDALSTDGYIEKLNCKADDKLTVLTASSVLKSTDLVPAFRCQDWPRTAVEWITRPREWPIEALKNRIVASGCLVVAKCPPIETLPSDVIDCSFRLSFSTAEIALADDMSPTQKLCWKILKAYQKGYLRTDAKVLTSYHWKTALLWFSEQRSCHFWEDSNLYTAVVGVLEFMIDCLENGVVPHYFVREMNLIKGCDPDAVAVVIDQIKDIRKVPSAYLKEFIEHPPDPQPCVIEVSKQYVEALKAAHVAGRPFENFSDEFIHGMEDCVTDFFTLPRERVLRICDVLSSTNECERDYVLDNIQRISGQIFDLVTSDI